MVNDFYASDEEYYLPGVQLYRGINKFFSISRPLSVFIDNKVEYYVMIEKIPFQGSPNIESNITSRIFLTKPEYYIAGKCSELLSKKERDLFMRVLSDRWDHVVGFIQDIYKIDNIDCPDYRSLPISVIDNNYIPDDWLEYFDKEFYYYLPYHHLHCEVLDGYDAPDDEESSRWVDMSHDLGSNMFITGTNHTADMSDIYVTVIKNGPYDEHMFRKAFNEWIVARVSILEPRYIHTENPDEIFTKKELERFNASIHNNWDKVLYDIHDTYYFGNDEEFNKAFSNLQCPDYSVLNTHERVNGLEFF